MSMDKWANFLWNEKLDPKKLQPDQIMRLIELTERLSAIRPPKISMHKFKLESRRLVAETAMDMGFDLVNLKHRGKPLIGRGLLDIWNAVLRERFDSNSGTNAEKEAKRRDIKTSLRSVI